MIEIEIVRDEQRILQKTIYTDTIIGRAVDADIKLDDKLCSRKHLKIYKQGSVWLAADLNSSNGSLYNEQHLLDPVVLNEGDKLKIGEHQIFIRQIADICDKGEQIEPQDRVYQIEVADINEQPGTYLPVQQSNLEILDSLKQEIHKQLLDELDLKKIDLSKLKTAEIKDKATEIVKRIIVKIKKENPLNNSIDENQLLKDIINEAIGLGPIEPLLEDKNISEIMINAKDQIYIEKNGKLEKTDLRFFSDTSVLNAIERIVSTVGRRVDESSPTVDARLKDGSRVHVIIPPLAIKGPTITIRKFSKIPYTIKDLIRFGSLTENMAEFLKIAISTRKNIIVSGGTGSGKTTLLNVLSSFISVDERIITIEDSAELKLDQPHVVPLEARPPNIEGKGAITIRELVRNALRMRPDRIIVGECRGGEALDMLQAMNTGHDGSLTTLHANSPRDALSRLETMVLMSGMELPLKAIREQIRSAINLIVQQTRFKDGTRRVAAISEVQGIEGDTIVLQDIFLFELEGIDRYGKITGRFKSTGFVPRFVEELRSHHINIPQEIFQ